MKTTLRFVLMIVGLASAHAAPGQNKDQRAFAHPVKAVEHFGQTITAGTSVMEVKEALGAPARKLGPEVWAYDHFSGGDAQAPTDNCDILLLTFRDARVAQIQLVNAAAQRVLAMRMETPAKPQTQFASAK